MTAAPASSRPEVQAAVASVQQWIDSRQRAMVAHLHSCNQSPAQLHVMGVLRELGPATLGQLASRLGISPPSASAIVDRMVDGGLVLRVRSDEDRRVVTVTLSAAGQEALQRAVGGRRDMLERVLGQLSDEELAETVRVLERLEQAIAAAYAGG